MNQAANDIFDFKVLRNSKLMNSIYIQIDVQKWDELGLVFKFNF